MKFGICTSVDKVEVVEKAGYDFVELPVVSALVPESSEAEFEKIRTEVLSSEIRPEVFNCFLPAGVKVVGPTVEPKRLRSYVERAIERAAALEGKIIVFGSGGARDIPANFPRNEALEQLVSLLTEVNKFAEKNGVVIALEPLRKEETNFINTVEEGDEIVRKVGRKNIRLMADLFHMIRMKEALEDIFKPSETLVHIHLASPTRKRPSKMDGFNYGRFFSLLKKIGYDSRISLECQWNVLEEEVGEALKFIKEEWGKSLIL